jgi:hypothetical protein
MGDIEMKNYDDKPTVRLKKAIFRKIWSIVQIAAMTAFLLAMAACKGTPTTPTTPTTPVVDTFGTLVGTFNGVDAYCNRNSTYRSNQDNFHNGVLMGKKWLCSEYVRRYYFQIYGYFIDTSYDGYATSFYELASEVGGLAAYPNGGSVAPQVGDIICAFTVYSYQSHVAIIREVGPNNIIVIQQNWNNSPLDNNERISRDGNTVAPFNLTYPIIGWLRIPSGNLKKY